MVGERTFNKNRAQLVIKISEKKLNFSFKKTRLIGGNAPSEEIQKEWVKDITKLIESSQKKNEVVIFSDPTHQIHNNINSYQWQPKGKNGTKTVLSNTGRKRINIIGAIEPLDLKPTTIITESNCDKEMMKCFLSQISKTYPQAEKIHVILDNATYNRAYEVQDEAKKLNINLVYLPPYSPNLNLIERLWKFFKKKITRNKYYATFEEFYKAVMDFFQNFNEFIPELRSLLTLNFEIIKTN